MAVQALEVCSVGMVAHLDRSLAFCFVWRLSSKRGRAFSPPRVWSRAIYRVFEKTVFPIKDLSGLVDCVEVERMHNGFFCLVVQAVDMAVLDQSCSGLVCLLGWMLFLKRLDVAGFM